MSDITIGKGNLAGKGVYAKRDFEEGEVVVEYNLRTLTEEEFEKLPESEKEFTHMRQGMTYLYLEPERYVNHSENPNTRQDFIANCDVAIRDIKRGEMITTDATKEDF